MRDLVVLFIHFIATLACSDLAVPVPSLPSRFCSSINS